MEENQQIEISLIDSVAKDNLTGLIESGAELTLDSILESEELKQVPIFGTLIKLSKAAASIRDRLFARKVYKFLAELSRVPVEQRISFIDDIEQKSEGRHRVGEAILLLLDRLDDMEKPSIVGKIYQQCMLGRIDRKQALRLAAVVDRTYITDLHDLVHFHSGKQIDYSVCAALSGAGLLEVSEIEPAHLTDGSEDSYVMSGPKYSITHFGSLLVETALLNT